MKIAIASDHRGYDTKQILTNYLKDLGYNVIDLGTNSKERVDYPKYGFLLGELVSRKEADYGIAICGSAIGISVACNKVKGIRCGKVDTPEQAIHAKENDFVNVIALSGEADIELNKKILDAFFEAKENLTDPAYLNRVKQIEEYENA